MWQYLITEAGFHSTLITSLLSWLGYACFYPHKPGSYLDIVKF